jgi:Yip1-like protein
MTVIEQGPGGGGLVARVKNILLRPRLEWEVIDAEPASIRGLYVGYICILAAIPPVAAAIGNLLFGQGLPGIAVWRPSPTFVILSAILSYAMSLVAVAVLALVIDALATSFGGTKDRIQAFKVAAYSYTAAWVAGIFGLIPALAIIGLLLGLYSFYLLYLGLPRLMRVPEDKAVGYVVVTAVIAILVQMILAFIVTAIVGATIGAATLGAARNAAAVDGGTVTVGGRTMDIGKVQAAAAQMTAAANGEPGAVKAVPGETLKAMLPGDLGGGFARTEISADSASAGGFGGSNAEGRYVNGDASIRLSVTDMAAAGALASLGGALNVESSRDTATGYERMGRVGGRMTTEKYDKQNRSGEYMVLVGDRFAVQAEGSGVDMNQLKAAVNAVNPGRLEAIAKG